MKYFTNKSPSRKYGHNVNVNAELCHYDHEGTPYLTFEGVRLIDFLKAINYNSLTIPVMSKRNNDDKWVSYLFFTSKRVADKVRKFCYAKENDIYYGCEADDWLHTFWNTLEEELIDSIKKNGVFHTYGKIKPPLKVHINSKYINQDDYDFWSWVNKNMEQSLLCRENSREYFYFQSEKDLSWFALKWSSEKGKKE